MQQAIKRQNITIRDDVQLIGYRGQIELLGRDLNLNGIVFNAPDGSVKVIVEGKEDVLEEFLNHLKRIREGVKIETKPVSRDSDLPIPFSRVATDDAYENMKRLDRGIELLGEIKKDTDLLNEIKTDTGLLKEIKKDTGQLVEVKDGITSLVVGQNKMIDVLGRIEAKLK